MRSRKFFSILGLPKSSDHEWSLSFARCFFCILFFSLLTWWITRMKCSFSVFILFRVPWASWTCGLASVINWGRNSWPLKIYIFLMPHPSPSLFRGANCLHESISYWLTTLGCSAFVFALTPCLLHVSVWVISIALSSGSLIPSLAVSRKEYFYWGAHQRHSSSLCFLFLAFPFGSYSFHFSAKIANHRSLHAVQIVH